MNKQRKQRKPISGLDIQATLRAISRAVRGKEVELYHGTAVLPHQRPPRYLLPSVATGVTTHVGRNALDEEVGASTFVYACPNFDDCVQYARLAAQLRTMETGREHDPVICRVQPVGVVEEDPTSDHSVRMRSARVLDWWRLIRR